MTDRPNPCAVTDATVSPQTRAAAAPSSLSLPAERRQQIIVDTLQGLHAVIQQHKGVEFSAEFNELLTKKLGEYVDRYYQETCVKGNDEQHQACMKTIYLDLHRTLKQEGITIEGTEFTDEVGQVLSLNFIWPQTGHLDRVAGNHPGISTYHR